MKTLAVLVLLAVSVAAFQIKTEEVEPIAVQTQVGSISWPFTVCGDGDWTPESLTLDQTPKRNINDNIVMVHFNLFSDWNC